MGKKKPTGRAAQKGKAQKAKNTSDGIDDPWSDHTPIRAFKNTPNGGNKSHQAFRGFTQNSPNGASPLGSSVKLRHQSIGFVTATASNQDTPTKPPPASHDDEEHSDDKNELGDMDVDEEDNDKLPQQFDMSMNIRRAEEMLQVDGTMDADVNQHDQDDIEETGVDELTSHPLFVTDTLGDPALRPSRYHKGKQPMMRIPSPSPSDSSEEVVFHGRTARAAVISDPPALSQHTPQSKTKSDRAEAPHITDDLLAALKTPSSLPKIQSPPPDTTRSSFRLIRAKGPQSQSEPQSWTPAPEYPYWRKGKRPDPLIHAQGPVGSMLWEDTSEARAEIKFVQQKEQDKNAEDTVTSLQAEWKDRLGAKKAAKQSTVEAADFEELESPVSKANRRGKRGRKQSNRALRATVMNAEDDDLATEAAYDDYMANLAAQLDSESAGEQDRTGFACLARSEFLAGPSLVVDGREIGEDEVLDKTHTADEWEDASSSDSDVADQSSNDSDAVDLSDLDSSDLEDELDYTLKEQWEDEEDLRQRRLEQKTDEQIARLFAKQQELGIDSEDLLIDDGAFASDAEEFGDLDAARTALSQLEGSFTSRPPRTPRVRRKRAGFTFPDATALADTVDQYGDIGFDIMDFDRPSLRPTKKGRKGQLPPELELLSDDELKSDMHQAWENDRSKKRDKKAERERLRMAGMLGSSGKKGKADLSMKYLEGMTMAQVRDELRIFLLDDGQQSRPFPPMDKKNRKTLHEIASSFNLNSKSVGSGKQRFPVLNKTSRTLDFSETHWNRIMTASDRGFLRVTGANKTFGSAKGNKFKPRGGQGGGFSSAATGLRNGEIVGANAAEIGQESFGHKLMQKMGWSKGMALGKDGEGMLLPVAQVMRSGKAGLG